MDLRGKEYFTEREAAHFCCCSQSKFRKEAPNNGIPYAIRFGKKVYRRADCELYMESAFTALLS